MTRARGWVAASVVALVLLLIGQIVHAVRGQSLTWDEGDHIFAGYESWKTHDYGLNPEHPPMVKMVATIPLLHLPLRVPALQGRFFKTESYLDGRELLYRNGPEYPAGTLIFRVRMFAMVFAVAGALVVFAAGAEMFGVEAGLVGLLLFCFEPNALAHGAYVATDTAASCTMLATVYAMWRWVKRPGWGRLLTAGIVAGLALAAKHSTVLLLPMLGLILVGVVAGEWWREASRGDENARGGAPAKAGREALRLLGGLTAVVVIGVVVLWGFYGFRYAARPAGLVLAPTLAEYVGPLAGVEARGILLAARLHILPESWLYGLADVRAMANGMPSYFFGKVYAHGVWFYFPVLFTIKSTLGMMGLLALAVFAAARGWVGRWREVWFVAAPPAVYLVVAMGSHLNIGARHILPVWIFCCVLAGAGAGALLKRDRRWVWAVGVLLVLHVGSSVHAAPNYISYANEAWGGPTKTYRYLSDSNTDWGQQLVATSAYLRGRGVKQCWFAYFVAPFVLPEDYGIPCRRLPTFDSMSVDDVLEVPPVIDGPVLISAGDLNGFEFGSSVLNPYEAFRALKPTAFVQNGVFVFDGRFAVPLASALGHVQVSTMALAKKDVDGAVRAAMEAERIAPGTVPVEMAVGDAMAAAGRKDEARQAYGRAMEVVKTMQAGARETWEERVEKKVAALGGGGGAGS